MGTDIHLYVEHRRDGAWHSADKWTDAYGAGLNVDYKDSIYSGRNYDVFAMLADVRNGRGFAGVDTGDGFVPISEPRGFPDDLSAEVQAMVDRGIEHTPTWLSVADLMAYNWLQTTNKRGLVDAIGWARFRDYGKPRGWCGDIAGSSIRHIDASAFEDAWQTIRVEQGYPPERYASAHIRKISGGNPDLDRMLELVGNAYAPVTWQVTYAEQAKDFLGTVIPRLWPLGSPEDVRLVFYFDS